MKMLHLPVLVAISISAPGIASAITISNATQLAAALQTAKGGEVFDLAPGDYGALALKNRIFSSPITFRSLDPSKPAVFGATQIYGTSGVRFDNVTFSNPLPASTTGFAIRMDTATNVSFNNVRIQGSMDGNAQNDGSMGLYINASSGISISNSEFTQLSRGIGVDRSSNIYVTGNNIYGIRSDGINMAQVDGVKLIGNRFSDFQPNATDHADAIQFWTTNTTVGSKNIEISNNLIVGKVGAQMQGIFLTDQSGGKLPYSNVTIKNNMLVGTAWQGIMLTDATGASVTGNTLVTIPGSTITATWINMLRVAGVLSGNEAKTFILKDSPLLKDANNNTNIISAALAQAVIEGWYDANQLVLLDPDAITNAPIGSDPNTINSGFNTTLPQPDDATVLTNTAVQMVLIDDNGKPKKDDPFGKVSAQLKKQKAGANTDVLSAVPEPDTWAQLLLGFGLVGWLIRQSRKGTRTSVG